MIEASQIRAARGFLRWSQADLAERAGVSVPTIKRIEQKGIDSTTVATVRAIEDALVNAGCTFLDDDGTGLGVRSKAEG